MVQFIYKEVNFIWTYVYDQMIQRLGHTWDEEKISEFHPIYYNDDGSLKSLWQSLGSLKRRTCNKTKRYHRMCVTLYTIPHTSKPVQSM